MSLGLRKLIIEDIIELLDVPKSAYESAERRYKDLGGWLNNDLKSKSFSYEPKVYVQGSFRLGTVIRPWKKDDYDLDLVCEHMRSILKNNITQKQLKQLIGNDLENYRKERNINEELEEKHRCWRLNYQDSLKFHMDIIPSIPETSEFKQIILERMLKAHTEELLSKHISSHLIAITDDRHPSYMDITSDWYISNPEGYAIWFESRMRQAKIFLESRIVKAKVNKIEDLPVYQWKTPLQQCIQVLKRHRDVMFENNNVGKPISAIITTLAAHSYQGETEVEAAMDEIILRMKSFINPSAPRVPNPVNPQEDFADKWFNDPKLENNFWSWLEQVKRDFGILNQTDNIKDPIDVAQKNFGIRLDEALLLKKKALIERAAIIASGEAHTASDGTIGREGVKNISHKFYG